MTQRLLLRIEFLSQGLHYTWMVFIQSVSSKFDLMLSVPFQLFRSQQTYAVQCFSHSNIFHIDVEISLFCFADFQHYCLQMIMIAWRTLLLDLFDIFFALEFLNLNIVMLYFESISLWSTSLITTISSSLTTMFCEVIKNYFE